MGYNQHIAQGQTAGLFSAGLITALFSASRAVRSITHSINYAYGITKPRSFLWNTAMSVIFTLCVGVVLILTTLLITASSAAANYLAAMFGWSFPSVLVVRIISWVICIIILFVIVSAVYFVAPGKKIKYRHTLAGSIFYVFGWGGLTVCFTAYIRNFSDYSIIYGSLGAIIILMLWLYFTGIVLILGAEINSALENLREHSCIAEDPKR